MSGKEQTAIVENEQYIDLEVEDVGSKGSTLRIRQGVIAIIVSNTGAHSLRGLLDKFIDGKPLVDPLRFVVQSGTLGTEKRWSIIDTHRDEWICEYDAHGNDFTTSKTQPQLFLSEQLAQDVADLYNKSY